jgi:hypothetical protein
VGYDLGNHERRKPDNTEVAILGGIRWVVKRHGWIGLTISLLLETQKKCELSIAD